MLINKEAKRIDAIIAAASVIIAKNGGAIDVTPEDLLEHRGKALSLSVTENGIHLRVDDVNKLVSEGGTIKTSEDLVAEKVKPVEEDKFSKSWFDSLGTSK